jgi:carbonic anhydrase/acetyltransferase-like protein (isoleucine patch superfamily)
MNRFSNVFAKAIRETGQVMDRLGLIIEGNEIFKETYTRHRPLCKLFDKKPVLGAGVFVAPSAAVVGEVQILDGASIWYGVVVRGDKGLVKIGTKTNVQDRAVISTVSNHLLKSGYPASVTIGDHVTIGHGALLTSCTVGNRVLIGQGSVIQEGCVIGDESMVAAGAVVMHGTTIQPGEMWAGNPAAFKRAVTPAEKAAFTTSATAYSEVAQTHKNEFVSFEATYQRA